MSVMFSRTVQFLLWVVCLAFGISLVVNWPWQLTEKIYFWVGLAMTIGLLSNARRFRDI